MLKCVIVQEGGSSLMHLIDSEQFAVCVLEKRSDDVSWRVAHVCSGISPDQMRQTADKLEELNSKCTQ